MAIKSVNIPQQSLFAYMEGRIGALAEAGRAGTACNYRYTLNSFRHFRGGEDLPVGGLTAAVVQAYETWLRGRGVAANSASFYMRILRAVYNHAAERGMTDGGNPFGHVFTGVCKTAKRALPLAVIKRVRDLDLSDSPGLSLARDMFMMSFYLRGMSFVDMCFLRKSDLSGGCLTYLRRKTGRPLAIAWKKEMQAIIDRYPRPDSVYLLPIIQAEGEEARRAYLSAAHDINRKLKKIAEMSGITVPLTLYVARHSWASGARALGVPLAVISEGMGHDSEKTTRIYLASLDTSAVDSANALVIDSL